MNEFDELLEIVAKLRVECPWDKEQTHEPLAKHLIEESYELLDAISKLDTSTESFEELKNELGDVLLQIFLHSKRSSFQGLHFRFEQQMRPILIWIRLKEKYPC